MGCSWPSLDGPPLIMENDPDTTQRVDAISDMYL